MSGQTLASEWVGKAESDYQAAIALARRRKNPLPGIVCFHCQQCAEKYLKAFLVLRGASFPKTHDLIAVKNLCCAIDPSFELTHNWLQSLEGYDVLIRYPGETPSLEDAQRALAAIKEVRQFARAKLGAAAIMREK